MLYAHHAVSSWPLLTTPDRAEQAEAGGSSLQTGAAELLETMEGREAALCFEGSLFQVQAGAHAVLAYRHREYSYCDLSHSFSPLILIKFTLSCQAWGIQAKIKNTESSFALHWSFPTLSERERGPTPPQCISRALLVPK